MQEQMKILIFLNLIQEKVITKYQSKFKEKIYVLHINILLKRSKLI